MTAATSTMTKDLGVWTAAASALVLIDGQKEMLEPEDVASVALFLASDGSPHVTGIGVVVDGGMRVW